MAGLVLAFRAKLNPALSLVFTFQVAEPVAEPERDEGQKPAWLSCPRQLRRIPDLATALREAGIYDYSIFLDEETLHLFAVLKLRPDNKRAELPQQPVMQRWWSYMADLMETEPSQPPRVAARADVSV